MIDTYYTGKGVGAAPNAYTPAFYPLETFTVNVSLTQTPESATSLTITPTASGTGALALTPTTLIFSSTTQWLTFDITALSSGVGAATVTLVPTGTASVCPHLLSIHPHVRERERVSRTRTTHTTFFFVFVCCSFTDTQFTVNDNIAVSAVTAVGTVASIGGGPLCFFDNSPVGTVWVALSEPVAVGRVLRLNVTLGGASTGVDVTSSRLLVYLAGVCQTHLYIRTLQIHK